MTKPKRPWIARPRHYIPLGLLALGVIVAIVGAITPWPAALLIRALFEQDADKTVAEMDKYVPKSGVDATLNQQYGSSGSDTSFDVFSPSDSTGPLPTVVWIHGGAWISGDKENVDPYLRMIAAKGYTTVALNYTVAPEAIYPVALNQLNDALAYLTEHADEYRIDPDQIVLAGDSAGANLASQLATIITKPDYAKAIGVKPTLTPEQLSAVVLDCGIYDVSGIPNAPGIGGWGFRIALWAYIGKKDWSVQPGGKEMGVMDDADANFPTTWISGGNGDPLTDVQSKPFATRLKTLGVDVTEVFYPKDTTPALPHEYQFHLDDEHARSALQSTIDFLGTVTK